MYVFSQSFTEKTADLVQTENKETDEKRIRLQIN